MAKAHFIIWLRHRATGREVSIRMVKPTVMAPASGFGPEFPWEEHRRDAHRAALAEDNDSAFEFLRSEVHVPD